jgi:hypothetical protein
MPARSPDFVLIGKGKGREGKGQQLIREKQRLWKYHMRLLQHVGNAGGCKEI